MKRALLAALATWLLVAAGLAPAAADNDYSVRYAIEFAPAAGRADVAISVEPGGGRLIEMDFNMPASVYRAEKGDGSVQRSGDRVIWTLPKTGGSFHYRVVVDQQRVGGGYESRMTPTFVITRGDHLFPPAQVRATKGSRSRATLHFSLPKGWRDVETPYARIGGGDFAIVNPQRKFDRPTGWMAAGDLVSTRETIAGTRVTVTAPAGAGADQVATLAILRQALPEMRDAFGTLPEKLLIVRAGDPMWRGGLSAPASLWLHADRPLISQNGTSPILHELTHVFTGIRGGPDDDWIAEGIAEYYSLEIGRRAGLISDERFAKAIRLAGKSGAKVERLRGADSSRDRTRKAVALFATLEAELRAADSGLDALLTLLMKRETVTLAELLADVGKLEAQASQVLVGVR